MRIAFAFVLSFVVLSVGTLRAADPPDETAAISPSPAGVPRYKFTVGEELLYRENEHLMPQPRGDFNKPRLFRDGDWRVWVVNENPDGSWRLVIRDDLRLLRTDSDTPVERFTNRVFAYCDVFPDGHVLPNETLGGWGTFPHLIDPCALFIPLPVDRAALNKGWSRAMPGCALPERGERIFNCTIDTAARSDGPIVINCTEHDPMHATYDQKESRRCVFDVASGRLLEYTRESDERGARKGQPRLHRHSVFKLKSVEHKPLAWVKQLKKESEQLFLLKREYDQLALECQRTRTLKECRTFTDRARERVVSAQKSATLEPVRDQYVNFLKTVDRDAKFALYDARVRETLYARGPATWELTGFDGCKHRLSDYRGKVVVLDFWFANCGWCLKSYPQVNEIARKYKERGVVVLGMNTDSAEEIELAQKVIRDMALNYTNLKARPALPAYQNESAGAAFGFPTLFILDQAGKIADIHEGYKMDLGQRAGATIDRLLANQARPTK
jgi:thiol-disulfide isomerase/thioredoxin